MNYCVLVILMLIGGAFGGISPKMRKRLFTHHRLLYDLFGRNIHEKRVYPYLPYDTQLVSLEPFIVQVYIDDAREVLVLDMIFNTMWWDRRVTWDPKDYAGLYFTVFNADMVWKPEITTNQIADITNVQSFEKTNVVSFHDGFLGWVSPVHYEVWCPLDLTYWPFDVQNCTIGLGSHLESGWMTRLKFYNGTNLSYHYNKIVHHWKLLMTEIAILNSTHKYLTDGNSSRIYISFSLKRTSHNFIPTVILPAVAILILSMAQFLLPLDHSHRIIIGCSNTVMVLVILLSLAMRVPPNGISVPVIMKFYGNILVLVILSVGICCLIAGLVHPDSQLSSYAPPPFILRLLTGCLGGILFVRQRLMRLVASEESMLETYKSVAYKKSLVGSTELGIAITEQLSSVEQEESVEVEKATPAEKLETSEEITETIQVGDTIRLVRSDAYSENQRICHEQWILIAEAASRLSAVTFVFANVLMIITYIVPV